MSESWLIALSPVIFLLVILGGVLAMELFDHAVVKSAIKGAGARRELALSRRGWLVSTGAIEIDGTSALFELEGSRATITVGRFAPGATSALRYDFRTRRTSSGDEDRAFVLLEAGLLDLATDDDTVELLGDGARFERFELETETAWTLVEVAERLVEVVRFHRELGERAEAVLLAGTRHKDDGLRHQSFRRLLRRFADSGEAEVAIRERRRDQDPRIRLTAALAGDHPDMHVLRALALEDQAPEDVRRRAMEAFASRGSREEVVALLVALLDRTACALAASEPPRNRVGIEVRRAIQDLQRDAARLLARHASHPTIIEVTRRASVDVLPVFLRALASDERDLAVCIAALLQRADDCPSLSSARWQICTLAIAELERIASDVAIAQLRRLMLDARVAPELRAMSREALAGVLARRGLASTGHLSIADAKEPAGQLSVLEGVGQLGLPREHDDGVRNERT